MSGNIASGSVKGKLVGSGQTEWLWDGFLHTETPQAALNHGHPDGTAQIIVVSGTLSVSLQGTDFEDADGVPTGFAILTKLDGNPATFTASGNCVLQRLPKYF